MKISKEEKSLYNFLNIFNTIFGKSEYRNTIVGRGNKCYFFTNGYCGVFVDKDRDTMVGGNYDFGNCYFELKQTPSKSFVLDVIDLKDDNAFFESIEKCIQLADTYMNCNVFKLEYEKSYEYKLAKIAEETGRWLKDSDIKYLDRFKKAEVFQLDDSIIVKSFGLTDEDCANVTTVLVFIGEVHPDYSDSTQQKMNVEPQSHLLENNTELLENSEDIMDDDIYPVEIEDETFDDDNNEVYF